MKTDNTYHTNTIVKIESETDKVKNFVLDTNIDAKPGQYVMVWLPGVNEKPFGVVSSKPLSLSIAKVGEFTEKIHALKVGDKLTWRGPNGNSFNIKGKKILLVAGGYGVVPLYFLASNLSTKQRQNTTVIIGAKNKSDLPFVKKFKELGCKVEITTDDGSAGTKGFSTELAEKLMIKEKYDSVYTCGPKVMMKKIGELCHQNKIYCQASLEKFFKCGGHGICGECEFKGKLLCKEGPVFSGSLLVD